MNELKRMTHVWNGTPIEYEPRPIPVDDALTLIKSLDYLFEDGDPRYVAVKDGEVIAVEWRRLGFCNLCVDSLWERFGHVCAFFPDYERKADGSLVYSVPCIKEEQ